MTSSKDSNKDSSKNPETGSQNDSLGGPEMQGEGNYTAARRHRESAEEFVGSGRVDKAARDAAPDNDKEAQEMQDAEKAGCSHARK